MIAWIGRASSDAEVGWCWIASPTTANSFSRSDSVLLSSAAVIWCLLQPLQQHFPFCSTCLRKFMPRVRRSLVCSLFQFLNAYRRTIIGFNDGLDDSLGRLFLRIVSPSSCGVGSVEEESLEIGRFREY